MVEQGGMASMAEKVPTQPRSLTLLGSTGSVGCSTLDLVLRDPASYDVIALTARNNVDLLVEQAKQVRPQMVAIADPDQYQPLKEALNGSNIHVAAGPSGLIEAAEQPSDWVSAVAR